MVTRRLPSGAKVTTLRCWAEVVLSSERKRPEATSHSATRLDAVDEATVKSARLAYCRQLRFNAEYRGDSGKLAESIR